MKAAVSRVWLPDAAVRFTPLLLWLPLLFVGLAWSVSIAVWNAGERHDEALSAVAILSEQMLPGVESDREALGELLVGSRYALPIVADVEIADARALVEKLDALERAMDAAFGLSAGAGATAASVGLNREVLSAALAEVAAARQTLLLSAKRSADESRAAMRQLQLTLLVLSVLGLALAALSVWLLRNRERAVEWRQLDHLLFDTVPLPVAVTDLNDRVVEMNDAFHELLHVEPQTAEGLSLPDRSGDVQASTAVEAMYAALADDELWAGELWMRRRDGAAISERVIRRRLYDHRGEPQGYVTVAADTHSESDERTLMLWQAHHDTLTKLPNRNLFNERLNQGLLSCRSGSQLAVLSIDLDRFKLVNDSIGPALGDRVLMETGLRIALAARDGDTVARLGGDQFAIVMSQIDGYAEAERVARSIVESIATPFPADDREVSLTASIGIALAPDDGGDAREIVQRADAAKATVQEAGGNEVAFFEAEMNDKAAARLELETDLRSAVKQNQLELHYQPLMDAGSGRIIGAEALLRWHHPTRGMVSPGEFIPVAEESGLIVAIGAWVVDEAQRQLHQWRARGWSDFKLSLNLSARQLQTDDDVDQVLAQIRRNLGGGLTVEITESLLIADSDRVKRFIEQAKARDVKVALDDFGTGFSSLSYLCDFNFDVLKIDRAFINSIESSSRVLGLVASIVSMGRILGMTVVAEGVEEAGQLQLLKQVGCDLVQGFYFSKPLPVAEFERFYDQS